MAGPGRPPPVGFMLGMKLRGGFKLNVKVDAHTLMKIPGVFCSYITATCRIKSSLAMSPVASCGDCGVEEPYICILWAERCVAEGDTLIVTCIGDLGHI
jgi:hypothetical protein